LNFHKLSEEMASNLFKNLQDVLTHILYYYDCNSAGTFKWIFKIDKDKNIRNKIFSLIEILQKENPFSSLSYKDAELLGNINLALNSNNLEVGQITLQQLADELGLKESRIEVQQKRNKHSSIMSIIGVVLTVFFGVISILLFLFYNINE